MAPWQPARFLGGSSSLEPLPASRSPTAWHPGAGATNRVSRALSARLLQLKDKQSWAVRAHSPSRGAARRPNNTPASATQDGPALLTAQLAGRLEATWSPQGPPCQTGTNSFVLFFNYA